MERRGTVSIFVKAPRPGRVKTRLAPAVGEGGAAALARAFFADTLAAVRPLTWARAVVAAEGELAELDGLLDGVEVWPQGEGDLGERLECVLGRALETAFYAIALGADTPGLPPRLIEEARAALALEGADAVIGPCQDGGFYLLGLRCCPEGLLRGIPWSDPETCACTLERFEALGIRTIVLDPWFDVDRPADLERLRGLLDRGEIEAPETRRAILAAAGRPVDP